MKLGCDKTLEVLIAKVPPIVADDWQSYAADYAPAPAALTAVVALSHDLKAVWSVADRNLTNTSAPCVAEGAVVRFD